MCHVMTNYLLSHINELCIQTCFVRFNHYFFSVDTNATLCEQVTLISPCEDNEICREINGTALCL